MDAYEEAIEQPYLGDEHGVSIELVGLAQTIDFLPWCVKFVWAIPSDTFDFYGFGHRRPYVILGLLLAAIAFAGLTLFNPAQFLWAYMICMISRNIGIALADCAIDGLSVDVDMDTEAGAISGWMSLGRFIGTGVASISAGYIAEDSYALAILASSAMLFIPFPATIYIKEEWRDEAAYEDKIEEKAQMTLAQAAAAAVMEEERARMKNAALAEDPSLSKQPANDGMTPIKSANSMDFLNDHIDIDDADALSKPLIIEESAEEKKKKLKRRQSFIAKVATSAGFDWDMLEELLSRRHVWLFLIYLALSTLGVAITNFALTAWAHESRGLAISEVGIVMTVMSLGCFMASLPMGYLFDYIPSKRSMMFFAAAICGVCNLILIWCDTKIKVYLGLYAFGAAHGVIYVVQCSMARVLADMRIAAAFFGLVNSICNLMHAFGTAFGGPIAGAFGYEACFLVGAGIDFLALLFCFLLPEAALRFSQEDVFDGKLKVLPHRVALQLAKERKTALNSELQLLKAGIPLLADAPHIEIVRPRRKSKIEGTVYGGTVQSSEETGAVISSRPIVSDHSELRKFLDRVPVYVPMSHLASTSRAAGFTNTSNDFSGPRNGSNYVGVSEFGSGPSKGSFFSKLFGSNPANSTLSSKQGPKSLRRRSSVAAFVQNNMGVEGQDVDSIMRATNPLAAMQQTSSYKLPYLAGASSQSDSLNESNNQTNSYASDPSRSSYDSNNGFSSSSVSLSAAPNISSPPRFSLPPPPYATSTSTSTMTSAAAFNSRKARLEALQTGQHVSVTE